MPHKNLQSHGFSSFAPVQSFGKGASTKKKKKPPVVVAPKPEPIVKPKLEPEPQLNLKDRLELEKARARNLGEEEPIIFGDRVIKPSALAKEGERAKTSGTLTRQQEILEREEQKRETTELPPEQLPPVSDTSLIEPEGQEGVLQQIGAAYEYIDTLGGLIPDAFEGEDVITGTVPMFGPSGPLGNVKQGKAALSSARALTSTKAFKTWNKVLKALKTEFAPKKMWKFALVGKVYLTDRKLSNIDSALSQVRESVTLPVSMASASSNPNRFVDAFDRITELEEDINEYESMVKNVESFPVNFDVRVSGRTLPIFQRIGKLRDAIELSRDQISKIEALGIVPTDEEVAIMLNEINQILDTMEDPTKFLGII